DAADDAPVSANVDFALVAGVKPAVAQNARGFLGAVPVARENMRTANDDFLPLSRSHVYAGNRWSDITGVDREARVIEGTDGRIFCEAVGLENGNAQHQEKLLSLRRQRRGAADERAKMWAETRFDFAENELPAERQPKRVRGSGSGTMAGRACPPSA